MKFAATVLFLLTILSVAACSRLPEPAVQHGTVQNNHSQEIRSDISVNLGTLACEPEGLWYLQTGKCAGTPAAYPTMIDGACTCLNEAYIPIPNVKGFTCVHLVSVFETVRAVRAAIARAGITEAESEGTINLDEDEKTRNRKELSVLSKDLKWIDRHLRDDTLPKRFVQRIRYAQYALEAYFPNPQSCSIPSPKHIRRSELLAHYPPIQ